MALSSYVLWTHFFSSIRHFYFPSKPRHDPGVHDDKWSSSWFLLDEWWSCFILTWFDVLLFVAVHIWTACRCFWDAEWLRFQEGVQWNFPVLFCVYLFISLSNILIKCSDLFFIASILKVLKAANGNREDYFVNSWLFFIPSNHRHWWLVVVVPSFTTY